MRHQNRILSKLSTYAEWKVRRTVRGGYVCLKNLEAETVTLSRSSVLRALSLPRASEETLELLEEVGIS